VPASPASARVSFSGRHSRHPNPRPLPPNPHARRHAAAGSLGWRRRGVCPHCCWWRVARATTESRWGCLFQGRWRWIRGLVIESKVRTEARRRRGWIFWPWVVWALRRRRSVRRHYSRCSRWSRVAAFWRQGCRCNGRGGGASVEEWRRRILAALSLLSAPFGCASP
jgi:hypothetical protein